MSDFDRFHDKAVCKTRDFYAMKPGAPIIMNEFGYFTIDKWISEGHINNRSDLTDICGFEDLAVYYLGGLGWCEAAFCPQFDVEIIEDLGEHEIERDFAGRHVLYFKGRRNGFMPEYVDHPVKDMTTWERDVKWRLDIKAPGRDTGIDADIANAEIKAGKGWYIGQSVIGGYMYLRSLIGPEQLLYMFYDDPALIHDCMKTWLELSSYVIARHQKTLDIDELYLAEDICYKTGSLISPDMFHEFLAPYYTQLISNLKASRKDKTKKLHIHIDTDGFSDNMIPLYKEIGMDFLSPFEGAAGCDVVRTAQEYPDLLMSGGMDKMQMAAGKDAIDRMVDRIMPAMRKRGGFIPTCDHGVPEEVSFEDYVYFRKRLLEYSK